MDVIWCRGSMEAAVAYPIFAQQNYANPRRSALKRWRARLR